MPSTRRARGSPPTTCAGSTGGSRSTACRPRTPPPAGGTAADPGCSDDRAAAGDGPADDQGVHLTGALVGVDRLCVGDEAADVVLEQDAVAAHQLAGPAHG